MAMIYHPLAADGVLLEVDLRGVRPALQSKNAPFFCAASGELQVLVGGARSAVWPCTCAQAAALYSTRLFCRRALPSFTPAPFSTASETAAVCTCRGAHHA
jgi:hypothetical protein